MNPSIADIRKDYKLASFDETDAAANPINQFTNWWNDATKSNIDEVNAMTLATVTPKNTPSARIVLLKGYDEKGFVFFSNYLSDKGKELSNNPTAALVFFWKELERQVRIEGVVEKVSEQESDEYFNSRPASSRIGAWASHQSAIIEYRQVIEQNVQKYTEAFGVENIPRPDHWGGYRVMPTLVEFWQGRSSRLHDRIQYRKVEQAWIKERLAP